MWKMYLAKDLNHQLVKFFLNGISNGFCIGFDYAAISLKSAKSNMESVCLHADIVDEYLQTEIELGHVAGTFPPTAVHNGHISRFGVIPKCHKPNKWCQIVDLSYPTGHSINDGISSPLCSLCYITVDDAVRQNFNLGRGCRLAKIDIKSAFRLLPVHPADRYLLLMK